MRRSHVFFIFMIFDVFLLPWTLAAGVCVCVFWGGQRSLPGNHDNLTKGFEGFPVIFKRSMINHNFTENPSVHVLRVYSSLEVIYH